MNARRAAPAILLSAVVAGAGDAAAWTVLKASVCHATSSYQYRKTVTIVTGTVAANASMSINAQWRPSPSLTVVTIDVTGKGTVTVRRLCQTDPWITGVACTDDKIVAQTNPAWGLGHVLKAAPDALAPKGLVAAPAKTPIPYIASQKWGGAGLPLAIRVSGTGPFCARRFDEIRLPGGSTQTKGPSGVPAGGSTFVLTAAHVQAFNRSGDFAVRSRIELWTGTQYRPGEWSGWTEFKYGRYGPGPAPGRPKP